MSEIIEILEHELQSAVEVKDRGSLHRYVVLLVENVVGRKEHERSENSLKGELGALRSDVALIAERMEQGFAAMDKRFEQVDKRFEQVDKRFEQVDKRFEELTHQMDKRFEQVDKRFEQLDKRFTMLVALTSTFFVVLATMMTVLRIFG